jgi:hypothetical protein
MSGGPWSSKVRICGLGPKGCEKDREGTKALVAMGAGRSQCPQTTVEPTCFEAKGSCANMIRRIRTEELRANGQPASLQLPNVDRNAAECPAVEDARLLQQEVSGRPTPICQD